MMPLASYVETEHKVWSRCSHDSSNDITAGTLHCGVLPGPGCQTEGLSCWYAPCMYIGRGLNVRGFCRLCQGGGWSGQATL